MRTKRFRCVPVALVALGPLAPGAAAAPQAFPHGYVRALFFLRHPAGLNRFVAWTAWRRSGGWAATACALRSGRPAPI